MGVLLMLVSYLVCNTGAIVYLYLRGERRAPVAEVVIPLIALAIIVYVLYQNTLADSLAYPYTVFPLVIAGWLVLGLANILLVPGLARRVGEGLAREEASPPRGTSSSRRQSASRLPVSSTDLRSERTQAQPPPAPSASCSPPTIAASVGAPSSSWMTVSRVPAPSVGSIS
jgi:hypothetical protein